MSIIICIKGFPLFDCQNSQYFEINNKIIKKIKLNENVVLN